MRTFDNSLEDRAGIVIEPSGERRIERDTLGDAKQLAVGQHRRQIVQPLLGRLIRHQTLVLLEGVDQLLRRRALSAQL